MEPDLDVAFGRIVGPLAARRRWRLRVRWVQASAAMARAAAVAVTATGRGLGDLGACFVGAPAAAWADVPTGVTAPR